MPKNKKQLNNLSKAEKRSVNLPLVMLKKRKRDSVSPKEVELQRKGLILPLYFGWQIRICLERIKDLKQHIMWPFKKYRQYITAVMVLIAIVSGGLFLYRYLSVKAATYGWVQTNWSGGATTTNATHDSNQTNWNYFSTSTDIRISDTGEIRLEQVTGTWTETSYADFASGTPNLTDIQGTGTAASLILDP